MKASTEALAFSGLKSVAPNEDQSFRHVVSVAFSMRLLARHISNIYSEGELQKESTVAKFAIVPKKRERLYEVTLYNLDVIISVGYRVKSQRGTQFRQWATKILKDYMLRGYAVNQRLLNIENQLVSQQKQLDEIKRQWKEEHKPKPEVFAT